MIAVKLKEGADFAGFRKAVRRLLTSNTSPCDVAWRTSDIDELFGAVEEASAPQVQLPAAAVTLAKFIVCHRDPERYSLLYDLIWRIRHGERYLMEVASDPLVHRLSRMQNAVARDIHKMHAFLRFRWAPSDRKERFIAWFEPQHFILEEAAKFFTERYPSFEWSILTPVGSMHWNCRSLTIGGPAQKSDSSASEDEFERGWIDYYRNTFNPARINTKLMQAEMPKKYWKNMPEAHAIADMVRTAPKRVEEMLSTVPSLHSKRTPARALQRAASSAPASIDALNEIIRTSEPFVIGGTKAVLGEGPLGPEIAFVGEQPGDQEDIHGRPFVGPAGRLFDQALAELGISRAHCYLTNAVKHFKFTESGKRRIHQTPTNAEIKHYRWWLQEELAFVRPRLIVALGASAAFALTGRAVRVTRERGPAAFAYGAGLITIHPSLILRLKESSEAKNAYANFVTDLKCARQLALQAA